MENHNTQPLLSPSEDNQTSESYQQILRPSTSSFSSFTADPDDITPVAGVGDFFKKFGVESRKLWYLAGPAIFTSICQYSLGAITQVFAGQVGTIELAAVSVENSVIAGFSFGLLLGMGSALETLCGQAFGAGQPDMLGIYMQRSWVILICTAFVVMFFYIFATPLLLLIGQTEAISEAAGTFAVWMIPQLYAYAINFPIAKFLQSQSKIMAMAWIAAVALVLHTLFSWLLMLKLGWGLVGAAIVLNASWWIIVIAQLVYIWSGTCGRAWTGFSWKAFQNLWGFVRLSLASAVMLCLEVWYFMALILFAGYLKNAEVSVDALSVCMNILGWTVMIALGCNAAIRGGDWSRLASRGCLCEYSMLLCIGRSFGACNGFQTQLGCEGKGIWIGMLIGTVVQTIVLFVMIYRTNWNKEASIAGKRIRQWGGETEDKVKDIEK
ncbi:hypothetical protein RHMOL_Rhmol12G0131800 [Rhododendron molle]|uniref:Uncharacterized protein n=1 Tax=Rhododendron molle TaxID=49168 RepID=A0ACC0LII4_RHOML|nr:hypothetical protein RHMOL_Rhmol12G0131800 [Rhododendron molle]